jgi:hypothetical protein
MLKVCQKGKPSTFNEAYPKNLKLNIKLQQQTPKDKNYTLAYSAAAAVNASCS